MDNLVHEVAYGFILLQVYLTLGYLYKGYQKKEEAWLKDLEEYELDPEEEEDADSLLKEKMEIFKILCRNVINPLAQGVDKLVRFGNKDEIGATAVSVSINKKNKTIRIAWRGDSVALV